MRRLAALLTLLISTLLLAGCPPEPDPVVDDDDTIFGDDDDSASDDDDFVSDDDDSAPPPPDEDGDGIPDSVEGTGDSDGDGIPDFEDLDSDDDGVPDATEGADDSDDDGTPDYLDTDSDDDGTPDGEDCNPYGDEDSGDGCGEIELDPAADAVIDWPGVDQSAELEITLDNVGDGAAAGVVNLTPAQPFVFEIEGGSTFVVDGGASVTRTVVFTPTAEGDYSALFSAEYSPNGASPDTEVVSVQISSSSAR